MKYLNKIDIFGTKFDITIFGDNQYNINFGEFLTVLYAAFSIFVTFLIGTYLYLRKNPKVLIDRIVFYYYLYMDCSISKLAFFWNFLDAYKNVVNFNEIITKFYNSTSSRIILLQTYCN